MVLTMRLIQPSPAIRSSGAPARTRLATFSGKRAASMAAAQPPWQSPATCARPPMWSMATTSSARYSSMVKPCVCASALFQSVR